MGLWDDTRRNGTTGTDRITRHIKGGDDDDDDVIIKCTQTAEGRRTGRDEKFVAE